MPQELREVGAFLETTNEATHRQVVLEAKIVEVELNDGYQAGINWAKMMTVALVSSCYTGWGFENSRIRSIARHGLS